MSDQMPRLTEEQLRKIAELASAGKYVRPDGIEPFVRAHGGQLQPMPDPYRRPPVPSPARIAELLEGQRIRFHKSTGFTGEVQIGPDSAAHLADVIHAELTKETT